jgi:hypothetical protein
MVFEDLHGIFGYTDFLGIGKRLMDWIGTKSITNVSDDSIKYMAGLLASFVKPRE